MNSLIISILAYTSFFAVLVLCYLEVKRQLQARSPREIKASKLSLVSKEGSVYGFLKPGELILRSPGSDHVGWGLEHEPSGGALIISTAGLAQEVSFALTRKGAICMNPLNRQEHGQYTIMPNPDRTVWGVLISSIGQDTLTWCLPGDGSEIHRV